MKVLKAEIIIYIQSGTGEGPDEIDTGTNEFITKEQFKKEVSREGFNLVDSGFSISENGYYYEKFIN